MTATTYTQTTTPVARARARGAARGWFRRAYDQFLKGQELRARRLIWQHLVTLSDDHLTQLGFDADEIRRLRKGEWVTHSIA